MKLTEKEAIEKTLVTWEKYAETGEEYTADHHCHLCKYLNQQVRRSCNGTCPYGKVFGACNDDKSSWTKWRCARTTRTRRKYAQITVEQLRTL